jgi:hypothetical protein
MSNKEIRDRIAELEKESEEIRLGAAEMRARIDQLKAEIEGRADKKATTPLPIPRPIGVQPSS